MARRIDMNRATAEEIAANSQVNLTTARLILDYRDRIAGFKDLTDIKDVPGVPDGTVTQLREAGFYVPGEREGAA
jgi:DNA uptake protein ComE-like DNA-binding protein